jgi:hypothetical protein
MTFYVWYDGQILTWHRLFLTIFRLFPVSHLTPIAPYSFMHYHGMDKGTLVATALQRPKFISPGWRLSKQPKELQFIAAGELASSRRNPCFPWLCFCLGDRLEQQICLSVCRVVNRNNSIMKQHVKIHLVYEAVLIIKLPDVSQKIVLSNFCSISTRGHIPDLNLHRQRR